MNTTISITKETRDILRDYGKKSETYDEVIKRMHNSVKMREMLEDLHNPKKWSTLEEAYEWTKKKLKEDDRKNKSSNSRQSKKSNS